MRVVLLTLFLVLNAAAIDIHAQTAKPPSDPVPTAFVREWLIEGGAAFPFYGPIVDEEYRNIAFPWWNLRVGHRITRELWILAAYDHYRENRESSGHCPEEIFPCPDTYVDDFHFNAYTAGLRWTFARSPNADAFIGAGLGVADVWRYSAHLVKLVVPAEVGVKAWVQRGQQFQWGPMITGRTILGMDEQWRVSHGALITDPVLVGLNLGLFARW
jgi:hypothetical protein